MCHMPRRHRRRAGWRIRWHWGTRTAADSSALAGAVDASVLIASNNERTTVTRRNSRCVSAFIDPPIHARPVPDASPGLRTSACRGVLAGACRSRVVVPRSAILGCQNVKPYPSRSRQSLIPHHLDGGPCWRKTHLRFGRNAALAHVPNAASPYRCGFPYASVARRTTALVVPSRRLSARTARPAAPVRRVAGHPSPVRRSRRTPGRR